MTEIIIYIYIYINIKLLYVETLGCFSSPIIFTHSHGHHGCIAKIILLVRFITKSKNANRLKNTLVFKTYSLKS